MAAATAQETNSLSAMDVKALRQATRVAFRHNSQGGTIEAIKELKKVGPFDDDERRYNIYCTSKIRTSHKVTEEPSSAFAFLYDACPTWRTVASLLRAGDEICLLWNDDGYQNQYCQGANLHVDVLFLHVRRDKQTFEFMLDMVVCPNNTARMIK